MEVDCRPWMAFTLDDASGTRFAVHAVDRRVDVGHHGRDAPNEIDLEPRAGARPAPPRPEHRARHPHRHRCTAKPPPPSPAPPHPPLTCPRSNATTGRRER